MTQEKRFWRKESSATGGHTYFTREWLSCLRACIQQYTMCVSTPALQSNCEKRTEHLEQSQEKERNELFWVLFWFFYTVFEQQLAVQVALRSLPPSQSLDPPFLVRQEKQQVFITCSISSPTKSRKQNAEIIPRKNKQVLQPVQEQRALQESKSMARRARTSINPEGKSEYRRSNDEEEAAATAWTWETSYYGFSPNLLIQDCSESEFFAPSTSSETLRFPSSCQFQWRFTQGSCFNGLFNQDFR